MATEDKIYFIGERNCDKIIDMNIQDITEESKESQRMGKALAEMSLEELWELFPVFLVAPNEKWKKYYVEMESFLQEIMVDYQVVRISHIGSTAIEGIWAKDIVDILLEIDTDEDMEMVAEMAEKNGFIRMSSDAKRISLNRGYTPDGFADKVYHLHLCFAGDHDELYFRDYLREHQEVAKAYEGMKLALWKQYEHDRDGYTNAKAAFVEKWTWEARKKYGGRYDESGDTANCNGTVSIRH